MTRRRTPPRSRANAGYSLIELMVAGALGLIVALAVTATLLTAGRQFTVTAATVSAQSSAQIALSLLESSGRTAGAGFYNNGQPICPAWHAWNGSALVSNGAAFMPARIVNGASAGASDTIVFTGGGGTRPLSGAPVLEPAANGASIKVSDGGSWADGDLAVIGAPGQAFPCTLVQITGAPTVTGACHGNATSCRLLVRNPNQGLNPNPTTFTSPPVFGFTTAGSAIGPAVVSRVGTAATGFRQDAYAIQCNALVRYNAFTTPTLPACTSSPLSFGAGVEALASDVVLMQAQYGITATASSDVVSTWVEPSGATWGGTPASAEIARIKAVRLVLVVRAREPQAGTVTVPCTNAAGVANTGPCGFQDAQAPVINLGSQPLPAGRTWQNYQYRVHKMVIPLRAVLWGS